MTTTGAKVLIEGLLRQGTKTIFGYPGGVVLPIYDVLYDSPLEHILVRHEQAAAHAADGYARASGKVGVCLATSGPGACNLVTGIATAYMDSIPLVALTGQVPTNLLGNDAFQESDIHGITMPVTKHNYLVKRAADLPQVIAEAFYIASTGRPGPVLVDIPKDVSTGELPDDIAYPETVSLRGYQPTVRGHPRQIEKAVDLLVHAERPLLYAGGGVILSGADRELTALAERLGAPVTTTLMGLGGDPRRPPAQPGHARHARDRVRELRRDRVRPARRDRRPVRRPGDRQDRDLRAPRAGDPHRHRPGRDREEQARRRPDRRRRAGTSSSRSSTACRRTEDRPSWLERVSGWREDAPARGPRGRPPPPAGRDPDALGDS